MNSLLPLINVWLKLPRTTYYRFISTGQNEQFAPFDKWLAEITNNKILQSPCKTKMHLSWPTFVCWKGEGIIIQTDASRTVCQNVFIRSLKSSQNEMLTQTTAMEVTHIHPITRVWIEHSTWYQKPSGIVFTSWVGDPGYNPWPHHTKDIINMVPDAVIISFYRYKMLTFDNNLYVHGHLNRWFQITRNITEVNKYLSGILNSWLVLPMKYEKLNVQWIKMIPHYYKISWSINLLVWFLRSNCLPWSSVKLPSEIQLRPLYTVRPRPHGLHDSAP